MNQKELMKGNEVIAEAAIRAGCRYYFGYPITPQSDISHYFAARLQKLGGAFVQAESEVAAINMLYGASAAGARCMTSSSSPGISLKQEGISYMACAQLPAVIVNIVRCGPGLGGILPAQCDYFQAVKGGGHGDYKMFTLAPWSIQECYELTVDAFNVADRYRVLSMIMGDGNLGQMMEPVVYREKEPIEKVDKSWATTGTKGKRAHNIITSININPEEFEAHNQLLQKIYRTIEQKEQKVHVESIDDADIIVVAYGSVARVVKNVLAEAKKKNIKVGMIRPITLWPFPTQTIYDAAKNTKAFLTVELSAGQMVEDVRLAVNGAKPVYFYGRMGGMVPTEEEIMQQIVSIMDQIQKKEA